MKSERLEAWFNWIDHAELPLCISLNQIGLKRWGRALFAAVSRLGDGVFWYALMAALPLVHGWQGAWVSAQMGLSALVGLAVYKALKNGVERPRPFVTHAQVRLRSVPLDRYSFPSGHTLHAVLFSAICLVYFPVLAWLLVPFSVLVILSRMVLGIHYPSDILAGALVGGVIAWVSFFITFQVKTYFV